MTVRAVIGANFGDEGKGLITDYFANTGDHDIVVRYNGGAQAGHTVHTGDLRHVFHHFGSGTLVGLPTLLGPHFIHNPIMFRKEREELILKNVMPPKVYAYSDSIITTPWHMNRNQDSTDAQWHGTCGMGVFETMKANQFGTSLTVKDVLDLAGSDGTELEGYLLALADFLMPDDNWAEAEVHHFMIDLGYFAGSITIADGLQWNHPLFEGAQGLLLSQDNVWDMPHLTPSYCGLRNVRELCYDFGITLNEAWYVSRTYMTRHGHGPLEGHDDTLHYKDDTNVFNPWQRDLRFAPLDGSKLLKRIHTDCSSPKLALTHCDQYRPPVVAQLKSFGNTRASVERESC